MNEEWKKFTWISVQTCDSHGLKATIRHGDGSVLRRRYHTKTDDGIRSLCRDLAKTLQAGVNRNMRRSMPPIQITACSMAPESVDDGPWMISESSVSPLTVRFLRFETAMRQLITHTITMSGGSLHLRLSWLTQTGDNNLRRIPRLVAGGRGKRRGKTLVPLPLPVM